MLALLFALGSVYFFTAVQGTVWFAAHVVAVALTGLFLLSALDAARPLLAGVLVACAWMTRPPLLLMSILFGLEALRISCAGGLPTEGGVLDRLKETWRRLDKARFFLRCGVFSAPIVLSFGLSSWMNASRFHNASPFAFGHEHLAYLHDRVESWGLFGTHYLGKNLGVTLGSLPWLPPKGFMCWESYQHSLMPRAVEVAGCTPFRIDENGLALWFTTPIYLWLFRPKSKGWLHFVLAVTAGLIAAMDLLYLNTGWRQFAYRFSNDYAPLLFLLLAVGARPMRWLFGACAVWGVAWSLFGAITFDKVGGGRFYWAGGYETVFQPDSPQQSQSTR